MQAIRKRPTRPRMQWGSDMDDMDLAHTATPKNRDGFSDPRSLANLHNLSSLQEIFPEVAVDMVQDVLIAAQFRVDIAASMLSELSREVAHASPQTHTASISTELDWTAIPQEHSTTHTTDQWFDLTDSRPELQQWVVVEDEWEVIEDPATSPTSPSTSSKLSFAEVIKATIAAGPQEAHHPLPRLQRHIAPTRSRRHTSQNDIDEPSIDPFFPTDKSFGGRKRRFHRKFRSSS